MKKSLSLVLIAVLAFGIGIAYAAPMLIVPVNIQPLPQVPAGPKADFSIDVVYAKFDPQKTHITAPEPSITYAVVFNVTNLSDKAATLYELEFAATQDVSVKQSILGGTIYDQGLHSNNQYKHFGGIVDGVYIDGKWVNVTWIPNIYYQDANGTTVQASYPLCFYFITQASWNNATIEGPLTPAEVINFSKDHTINGTIPELPANASNTGIWFEGVPITEYYDQSGNPIITEMYINGVWVDVTGKVTVDQTKPTIIATNMLMNQQLPIGSDYQNMNSTVGQVTTLPTWGDWDVGTVNYVWVPFEAANQQFNPTFAPHESKLIIIQGTQNVGSLSAFESGTIKTYASASNYVTNWPVNGTYYDTISTATQIKQLQLEQTRTGYLFKGVLADNETFQRGNSYLEVTIVPRTEP
jgi:hypothetical protein